MVTTIYHCFLNAQEKHFVRDFKNLSGSFRGDFILWIVTGRAGFSHRRSKNTGEKAIFVAAVWGTKFSQFPSHASCFALGQIEE